MSNTYAWATDIHLDHLRSEDAIKVFAEKLIEKNPTGVILTGDLSSAKRLVYHLSILETVVARPIYFVLGNHDYYESRIEEVRKTMKELVGMSSYLKYMSHVPYVSLTNSTGLVGHDGWYDALYGDVLRSRFGMSDWQYIGDFYEAGSYNRNESPQYKMDKIIPVARKLAHEGVTHMMNGIKKASKYHKNIIVATHVPPFEQAHIFEGAQGSPDTQPWFTSKMCGDMLLDAARTYSNINFTVLCGHTHGEFVGKILPNLIVRVGGTDYGNPVVQDIIEAL